MDYCFLMIISKSGLPILLKKSENFPNMPYPLQAALSGSHVFAQSVQTQLLSFHCDKYSVTWQEYEQSITLILILRASEGASVYHARRCQLVDLLWQCALAAVGKENLIVQEGSAVEGVKKRLQRSFAAVVEVILADCGGDSNLFSGLTGSIQVTALRASAKLKRGVQLLAERADSAYALVLLDGQLASATDCWSRQQLTVLTLIARAALTPYRGSDCDPPGLICLPVFLPLSCSRGPFRLVLSRSMSAACCCCIGVLCGPSPELSRLADIVSDAWLEMSQLIRKSVQQWHESCSDQQLLSQSQLGILIENLNTGMCCRIIREERGGEEADSPRSPGATDGNSDSAAMCNRLRLVYQFFDKLSPASKTTDRSGVRQFQYELSDSGGGSVYLEWPYRLTAVYDEPTHPCVMREVSQSAVQFIVHSKAFSV